MADRYLIKAGSIALYLRRSSDGVLVWTRDSARAECFGNHESAEAFASANLSIDTWHISHA